jgi:two-component system sensor histidine kinase HydH
VVAHEVRNPLAGVRGTLQVLASRLPDHMRERAVISTMVDRIDELNDKVTDLLVYARPTEPRLQPVPVAPLIADAAASARATMGNAAAGFHISGEPGLVRADPDMLRPVLLNLLLNAYQAGGDHPIEIDVCRQNGTCTVAVLDRGPGIPPDVRERIFEPFYTTKRGGTGLGLPVVKRLVEMQGGTVALRERTGGGTAAEVTLPAA